MTPKTAPARHVATSDDDAHAAPRWGVHGIALPMCLRDPEVGSWDLAPLMALAWTPVMLLLTLWGLQWGAAWGGAVALLAGQLVGCSLYVRLQRWREARFRVALEVDPVRVRVLCRGRSLFDVPTAQVRVVSDGSHLALRRGSGPSLDLWASPTADTSDWASVVRDVAGVCKQARRAASGRRAASRALASLRRRATAASAEPD